MPIDPMPMQPGGLPDLNVQPPQSESLLDTLAKVRQLRQEQQMAPLRVQQAQQQVQGGALDLQQKQMEMAQTKALNDAYMNSIKVGPDGAADIDTGSLTQALARNNAGAKIPAVLKGIQEYKQSAATLQKTNEEVAAQQNDFAGSIGAAVKAAEYDPHLFLTMMGHAGQSKTVDPQHVQPLIDMVQKSLQNDPTGESAKALTQKITDQMIQASPKQREIMAAEGQAVARQQTANTGKARESREAGQQQFQSAISDLGANPPKDAAEYQDRVGKLPYSLAARIFSAVPAAQYDPSKVATIRQLGMTPEQQTQATEKAKEAATPKTEAELALKAVDPKATDEEKAAANAALSRLDKSKRDSRPVVNVTSIPGLGGPQTGAAGQLSGQAYLDSLPPSTAGQVRAIAEGRAVMPSAQSKSQAAQQLRSAVFQYDPTYNDQRAQVRRAFTTGTDGRNIGALNTATVHLDQFADAADALKNGDFRPGNSAYNAIASAFGSAAPTNFESLKSAVAGEIAAALKGSATDIEIHNVAQNINAFNSPAQLADAVKTNLDVLRAKLNTYQERYQRESPGDTNWTPVLPSAQRVFQKRGIEAPGGAAAPATIRVKRKSDGQTGSIPAANFDSTKYDKL